MQPVVVGEVLGQQEEQAVHLASVEMVVVTSQMQRLELQAPDLAVAVAATSLLLGLWEVVGLTV